MISRDQMGEGRRGRETGARNGIESWIKREREREREKERERERERERKRERD